MFRHLYKCIENLAFILNKASKNDAHMAQFPRESATMAKRIPQGTVMIWMMLDFLFYLQGARMPRERWWELFTLSRDA